MLIGWLFTHTRPAQLGELSRSEFDPELFSHSANDNFFCDIRDKSVVFNILRQNETIFDPCIQFRVLGFKSEHLYFHLDGEFALD